MVRAIRLISRIIGIGGGIVAALFFGSSIYLGMMGAGAGSGAGSGPGDFAAGGGAAALGILGLTLIPAIGLQIWADRIQERQLGGERERS